MNIMRYLKGNLHFNYIPWQGWFHFSTNAHWGGRLLYLNISRFSLHLDCRKNWLNDMATGNIE